MNSSKCNWLPAAVLIQAFSFVWNGYQILFNIRPWTKFCQELRLVKKKKKIKKRMYSSFKLFFAHGHGMSVLWTKETCLNKGTFTVSPCPSLCYLQKHVLSVSHLPFTLTLKHIINIKCIALWILFVCSWHSFSWR